MMQLATTIGVGAEEGSYRDSRSLSCRPKSAAEQSHHFQAELGKLIIR